MNTDRIIEIQKETAYPDSMSVWRALLQVWNECDHGKSKPIDNPKSIQILRDVETEVNISGIISNHTYAEIVKLLKEIDGN